MTTTYEQLTTGTAFRFKGLKASYVKLEDCILEMITGKERQCASSLASVEAMEINAREWEAISPRARFEINRLNTDTSEHMGAIK